MQYGLQALRAGRISPTEFLNLNARVGSWKNEPQMVQEGRPFVEGAGEVDVHGARNMRLSREDAGRSLAPRAEADPGAIAAAYREGFVFRGDLEIPVIDWRPYLERGLDMHSAHQSFAARRRMLDHDGDAGNQVIWFTDVRSGAPRHDQTPLALEVIDAWMAPIRATPGRSVAESRPTVPPLRNRPDCGRRPDHGRRVQMPSSARFRSDRGRGRRPSARRPGRRSFRMRPSAEGHHTRRAIVETEPRFSALPPATHSIYLLPEGSEVDGLRQRAETLAPATGRLAGSPLVDSFRFRARAVRFRSSVGGTALRPKAHPRGSEARLTH